MTVRCRSDAASRVRPSRVATSIGRLCPRSTTSWTPIAWSVGASFIREARRRRLGCRASASVRVPSSSADVASNGHRLSPASFQRESSVSVCIGGSVESLRFLGTLRCCGTNDPKGHRRSGRSRGGTSQFRSRSVREVRPKFGRWSRSIALSGVSPPSVFRAQSSCGYGPKSAASGGWSDRTLRAIPERSKAPSCLHVLRIRHG